MIWLVALVVSGCAQAGAALTSGESAVPAASAQQSLAGSVEDTLTFRNAPVGFTSEGYPYRGSLEAPITMVAYSDFQCPFCARHFVQTEGAIDEAYVQSGKVRMIFRDLPLVQLHPNAPAAHEAAACIGEQGAPLYWAMYDELFRSQSEWSDLGDPSEVFSRLAEEVGADATAFADCVAGTDKETQVQASVDDAQSHGFDGTPSFQFQDGASGKTFALIGAQPYSRFAETIDAILAGDEPPNADAPQAQGVPFWATAQGIAADPNRPGLTIAGDQTRGNVGAPVVVVEFQDFQCPFCKQHGEKTQPTLDEAFVDTGKVRWVFKHFPLDIHAQAPAAGVAAECASDQGKFWEMNDLLFDRVTEWSVTEPNLVFVDLAQELGLDTAAFEACLTDPSVAERIQSDLADGAPYVQGTPTFIVLQGGQGRIIPGALPLGAFRAELQKAVDATAQ
jgi:protein-disulfide isomerase